MRYGSVINGISSSCVDIAHVVEHEHPVIYRGQSGPVGIFYLVQPDGAGEIEQPQGPHCGAGEIGQERCGDYRGVVPGGAVAVAQCPRTADAAGGGGAGGGSAGVF